MDGIRWCDDLNTSQLCLHHFTTCELMQKQQHIHTQTDYKSIVVLFFIFYMFTSLIDWYRKTSLFLPYRSLSAHWRIQKLNAPPGRRCFWKNLWCALSSVWQLHCLPRSNVTEKKNASKIQYSSVIRSLKCWRYFTKHFKFLFQSVTLFCTYINNICRYECNNVTVDVWITENPRHFTC